MNVVGISREELFDLVTEKGKDGVLTINGITVTQRSEEKKSLDVRFGKVDGFLLPHDNDMAGLYMHKAVDLGDLNQFVIDARHVAKTFGVDLAEGKVIDIKENPVIDEKDVEIAELKAKVSVYQSLMPSTDTVTFKKDTSVNF